MAEKIREEGENLGKNREIRNLTARSSPLNTGLSLFCVD